MTTAPVKENLRMRAVQMSDIERVTALLNICSVDQIGSPEWTVETLRNEWTSPGVNVEESMRVVETSDGQIVGYVEVADYPAVPARIWVNSDTHPDYRGLGIGTQMMDWAEARARQALDRVPADARVVILCDTLSTDHDARRFLEDRGMQYIRTFWQMRIEMDEAPPAPHWPEGITIRTLVPENDLRRLIEAKQDIWRDHWGNIEQPLDVMVNDWSHFIENDSKFDPTLWFMAMDGDEIVGLSLCWLESDEDPSMSWVGVLGVKRHWRRKGLALALLQHSFGEFWRRGKRLAGLGVDAANPTGATHLYEKAGMHAFREWTAYELELRPGRELMTAGR